MKALLLLSLFLFSSLFPHPHALAQRETERAKIEKPSKSPTSDPQFSDKKESASQPSTWRVALLYLPNRVLDLLDIVRARVRVGPGIGVGARVTEPLSGYLGSYIALYGGFPGPRMRTIPRSPVGLESYSGASLSVLNATVDLTLGPNYSPTEIGAGVQLVFVGFDVGIDPLEIVDFLAGIFLFDIREDDF